MKTVVLPLYGRQTWCTFGFWFFDGLSSPKSQQTNVKTLSKALSRLLSGQVVKTIASSEQYQTSLNVFSPVPIVQKTVGQYAKHIVYYSETEDPSIPTENIGVPNTERGNVVILNVLM